METPPSVPAGLQSRPDRGARGASRTARWREGRCWLSEPEAKEVLAAYGVPVVADAYRRHPARGRAAAAEIGGPVALKILSPDIVHKSDVGGVALDLDGAWRGARAAAEAMLERVRPSVPDARLSGFTRRADGPPARRLRADRRGRDGPAVRAGRPVRPRRHRRRGGQRQARSGCRR